MDTNDLASTQLSGDDEAAAAAAVTQAQSDAELMSAGTVSRQRAEELARARSRRRAVAIDWEPHNSAATLRRKVILHSPMVQRGFHLTFARAQIAAFQLMAFTPLIADAEKTQALESLISDIIQKVETQLEAQIAQLDALLKNDGITLGEKDYSKPETLEVKIFSPTAGRFLRLAMRFDDAAWRAETLWLNGSIPPHERTRLLTVWKGMFYGLPRALQGLWVRERGAVRRMIASKESERREREIARATRDLEIAEQRRQTRRAKPAAGDAAEAAEDGEAVAEPAAAAA